MAKSEYYITVIYPDKSVSGPSRLSGLYRDGEAYAVFNRQKSLNPHCRIFIAVYRDKKMSILFDSDNG